MILLEVDLDLPRGNILDNPPITPLLSNMWKTRIFVISAVVAFALSATSLVSPCLGEEHVVTDEDDYEDETRAFLLVKKALVEEVVVQGRNFTVKLDLFNAGEKCEPRG